MDEKIRHRLKKENMTGIALLDLIGSTWWIYKLLLIEECFPIWYGPESQMEIRDAIATRRCYRDSKLKRNGTKSLQSVQTNSTVREYTSI